MEVITKFKSQTLTKRRLLHERLMQRHGENSRVACIIDRLHADDPAIEGHKILVSADESFGSLIGNHLTHKVKLDAHQSLFYLIRDTLVSPSDVMGTLYEKYKDDDGFLYIVYTTENTFGVTNWQNEKNMVN